MCTHQYTELVRYCFSIFHEICKYYEQIYLCTSIYLFVNHFLSRAVLFSAAKETQSKNTFLKHLKRVALFCSRFFEVKLGIMVTSFLLCFYHLHIIIERGIHLNTLYQAFENSQFYVANDSSAFLIKLIFQNVL